MKLLYIAILGALVSGTIFVLAEHKVSTPPPGVYKQPQHEVKLRIVRRELRALKKEVAVLKERVTILEAAAGNK